MSEGFYEVITKHLDEIDKKIEKLEKKVGLEPESGNGLDNYSVDEILDAIVPRPFEFDNTVVVKDELQPSALGVGSADSEHILHKEAEESAEETVVEWLWRSREEEKAERKRELDKAYDRYIQAVDKVRNR